MNNHHSNNLLLNLGIESLNEMQLAAQEAILENNSVLLLSPTGSGRPWLFYCLFLKPYSLKFFLCNA